MVPGLASAQAPAPPVSPARGSPLAPWARLRLHIPIVQRRLAGAPLQAPHPPPPPPTAQASRPGSAPGDRHPTTPPRSGVWLSPPRPRMYERPPPRPCRPRLQRRWSPGFAPRLHPHPARYRHCSHLACSPAPLWLALHPAHRCRRCCRCGPPPSSLLRGRPRPCSPHSPAGGAGGAPEAGAAPRPRPPSVACSSAGAPSS